MLKFSALRNDNIVEQRFYIAKRGMAKTTAGSFGSTFGRLQSH